MGKRTTLGPWSGINNVHRASARAFQVPNWKEKHSAALVAAQNVDINNDGWTTSRAPVVTDTALGSGVGGWDIGGRFFFQDGGRLYERTSTGDVVVLKGLSRRAEICEHWGDVFVTDGEEHRRLVGQTVVAWGLPVPTLSLAPAHGSLAAGHYLVRCAFVDAQGSEGGVSDISPTTLTFATGISVHVSGASSVCDSVNVYVSDRDQKQTSFLANVSLGAFPYTVETAPTTVADPPKTHQMTGPISDAAGLFSFRAFLLAWRGNAVFRSEAAEPDLFHGEHFMQFGSDVRACEGVVGGMWIGTASGLWWVRGENPEEWVPEQKTFNPVSHGSTQIQGEKIPLLNTKERVALFVTTSGLVAGMPDGMVIHLTDGTYTFDDNTRASFAYIERNNLRQLVVNLVNNNGRF